MSSSLPHKWKEEDKGHKGVMEKMEKKKKLEMTKGWVGFLEF